MTRHRVRQRKFKRSSKYVTSENSVCVGSQKKRSLSGLLVTGVELISAQQNDGQTMYQMTFLSRGPLRTRAHYGHRQHLKSSSSFRANGRCP